MGDPIIPQALFFDATIGGTTATALDRTTLRQAKLTNTIMTGSAKASLTYAVAKGDARRWPWGLRAMDSIAVQAWASGRPDDASRVPIWSGFLDAVTISEDPSGGFGAQLDASTVWKALEVTTETPGQFDIRTNWMGVPASDIVTRAALTCGVPVNIVPGVDPVTDVYSLAATDHSIVNIAL
jgi:hypothetical protein